MLLQIRVMAVTISTLLAAATADAQNGWQVHPANPVMTAGGTTWDAVAVGQPSCLVDGDRWRMWYTGAAADLRGRILHAESADGVEWTRHQAPVLDVGADGDWDGAKVDTPAVVRVGDLYFLYYFGQREMGTVDGSAIGLAVSSGGLVFDRVGEGPVLEPGPPGSWDARWIESPTVVYDDSSRRFFMWYTGMSAEWKAAIGRATSIDGTSWLKDPANPVIGTGPDGSWDDMWVAVPTTVALRSGYWLFYSGVNALDLQDGRVDHAAVGFVWSGNGSTWLGDRTSPVLGDADTGPTGPWAASVRLDPSGETLLMWYETGAGINLATSSPPARCRRGTSARAP